MGPDPICNWDKHETEMWCQFMACFFLQPNPNGELWTLDDVRVLMTLGRRTYWFQFEHEDNVFAKLILSEIPVVTLGFVVICSASPAVTNPGVTLSK